MDPRRLVPPPAAALDRARRVLWATPGAQRQWREGEPLPETDLLGRHTVLWGDAHPPAWIGAADVPQVELAPFGHLDERRRFAVPTALLAAGIDAAGEYTWDEEGAIRLRITVAAAEADSARRLLALLGLD